MNGPRGIKERNILREVTVTQKVKHHMISVIWVSLLQVFRCSHMIWSTVSLPFVLTNTPRQILTTNLIHNNGGSRLGRMPFVFREPGFNCQFKTLYNSSLRGSDTLFWQWGPVVSFWRQAYCLGNLLGCLCCMTRKTMQLTTGSYLFLSLKMMTPPTGNLRMRLRLELSSSIL